MPLLFTIYLLLWIKSFVVEGVDLDGNGEIDVDEQPLDDNGRYFDENHAKNVFSKIVLCVGVVTIALMPVIGWFSDKFQGYISVPTAFFCRCAVMLIFLFFVKEPESALTYVICTFMITFSFFERVAVEKMFLQSLPSNVRGTMIGFLHLFGQIG